MSHRNIRISTDAYWRARRLAYDQHGRRRMRVDLALGPPDRKASTTYVVEAALTLGLSALEERCSRLIGAGGNARLDTVEEVDTRAPGIPDREEVDTTAEQLDIVDDWIDRQPDRQPDDMESLDGWIRDQKLKRLEDGE